MNVFVFDIETIPDVAAGRRLYDLHDLSDSDVVAAMQALRREKTGGSDFMPHYLQQIVAISVVFRYQDKLSVWSLGDETASEAEIIERFFAGIDKYQPNLVSWNGSGFDLPVLHYRALLHGVAAPKYWETGAAQSDFRWNNYLNRFHERHLDLMDVIAGYQNRAFAPLDEIAQLCGFPGKLGMDGSKVFQAYSQGQLAAIRHYCETDVLNTYLVYLNFERVRGNLSTQSYHNECQLVRSTLAEKHLPHLDEFLAAWVDA